MANRGDVISVDKLWDVFDWIKEGEHDQQGSGAQKL